MWQSPQVLKLLFFEKVGQNNNLAPSPLGLKSQLGKPWYGTDHSSKNAVEKRLRVFQNSFLIQTILLCITVQMNFPILCYPWCDCWLTYLAIYSNVSSTQTRMFFVCIWQRVSINGAKIQRELCKFSSFSCFSFWVVSTRTTKAGNENLIYILVKFNEITIFCSNCVHK